MPSMSDVERVLQKRACYIAVTSPLFFLCDHSRCLGPAHSVGSCFNRGSSRATGRLNSADRLPFGISNEDRAVREVADDYGQVGVALRHSPEQDVSRQSWLVGDEVEVTRFGLALIDKHERRSFFHRGFNPPASFGLLASRVRKCVDSAKDARFPTACRSHVIPGK